MLSFNDKLQDQLFKIQTWILNLLLGLLSNFHLWIKKLHLWAKNRHSISSKVRFLSNSDMYFFFVRSFDDNTYRTYRGPIWSLFFYIATFIESTERVYRFSTYTEPPFLQRLRFLLILMHVLLDYIVINLYDRIVILSWFLAIFGN